MVACISRDGRKLYFSSGYRQSFPTCAFQGIYVSQWDSVAGSWAGAAWLGAIVNSGLENFEPSPGGDDTTLYFAGDAAVDSNFQGDYDLTVAYFNGSSWYRVANPGAPLNSADWDRKPSISADGKRLFFASRRDDSTYNSLSDNIFVAEKTVGVKDEKSGDVRPVIYALTTYPNPFNSSVRIRYTVKITGEASVIVYNLLGQKVAILEERKRSPGNYEVIWAGIDSSGKQVGSGIYFCVFASEGVKASRKLVLLK